MELTNFEKALGFSLGSFEKRIYALCDYETLLKKDITLEQFVQISQKLDVKLIQYRDKVSSLETQKTNLLFLKQNLEIPIIINDKVELIEFCDGLHLGQEDFDSVHTDKSLVVKILRKKIGNKLLGLSTHNEIEILEANDLDIDMIGLGAYRATNTKDVANILGDNISYLAKISKHPVCAIGGVKKEDEIENISFNVIGSGLYGERK